MEQLASEHDDLRTARGNSEYELTKAYEMHKAVQIRIKQRYNCEEQLVSILRAPFRGFSVQVRFKCRAKIHPIKLVSRKREEKRFEELEKFLSQRNLQKEGVIDQITVEVCQC
ncbi:unnamed protein product [Caenorhabditis bovis]|uniref:Uncharacterized protein n=1 Tax=Caenorhabditis bovis TaxID=2654633 RepID=A0A8S1FEC0_9PELO|nr:unnamed protein product [Caenorhabditis bovis]